MNERLAILARALLAPAEAAAQAADSERRAAVACVFLPAEELRVLLMRRAERPGDRWSGQISFPGGHADAVDLDLESTARRETLEEVGLDLTSARLLGCLPTRHAKARGTPVATTITPFVYQIDATPTLNLGPEAARAFWLPFERAWGGALDDHYVYDTGQARIRLPAWRHESELVWGMTYEMLQELSSRARG